MYRYNGIKSWRRQLDGSRSPFDQLAEIVDAVGDKLDVICEGGIIEELTCLKHYRWVPKLALGEI